MRPASEPLASRLDAFDRRRNELRQQSGRPRGRPTQGSTPPKAVLSSNEIADRAAKAAGFYGREEARQAGVVLERGTFVTEVDAGKMSIYTAYQLCAPARGGPRASAPTVRAYETARTELGKILRHLTRCRTRVSDRALRDATDAMKRATNVAGRARRTRSLAGD